MDTLVTDGDFSLNVCGVSCKITSIEEACQRVRVILSVEKGSFVYDRSLGVDFSSLENCSDIDKTAKLLCDEALVSQTEIRTGAVSVNSSDGKRTISVEVLFGNESKTVEVEI